MFVSKWSKFIFLSTKLTDSGYIACAQQSVGTSDSIKFYIQPGINNNRQDGCGSFS